MPSQKQKGLAATIRLIDRQIDQLYRKRRKAGLLSRESASIHEQLITLIDRRRRLTEELRLKMGRPASPKSGRDPGSSDSTRSSPAPGGSETS